MHIINGFYTCYVPIFKVPFIHREMHTSQAYHLMRFDKYIHRCDPNSYQVIEYYHDSRKFCSKSEPTSTPHIQDVLIMVMCFATEISYSFLVHLHINEFDLCIFFCVWLPSLYIMFLKFIHVVVSAVQSLLPILKNCLLKAPVILSLLKSKANHLRNKTRKGGKKKRERE